MSTEKIILLCFLILLSDNIRAQQEVRPDVQLLNRIYDYQAQIDTSKLDGQDTYSYRKFTIHIVRRNITLFPIPTLYRIAHSKNRKYIEENVERIHHNSIYDFDVKRIAHMSTIPQQKETMTSLHKYLTPKFYEETIFGNEILSPFHKNNKIYYSFSFKYLYGTLVELQFKPKVKNTQLIAGSAIIDSETGRIVRGVVVGEFDMITFELSFTMSEHGIHSLFPKQCVLNSKFSFMGNIINARNIATYNIQKDFSKEEKIVDIRSFMDSIRTDTLTVEEQQLYDNYYQEEIADSITRKARKRSWAKKFFWDILGDNLLNKITSDYGENKQGHMRVNPLFNPLYMGYSGRKGYYYKFDIRNRYSFSYNNYLYTRIKAGYSFKQRQLYYNIPIEYHFNRKHNGYIRLQYGNGNWIANGLLKDELLGKLSDTTGINNSRLEYFKDSNISLEASYDISSRFTVQIGLVGHKRKAVETEAYAKGGMPTSYTSVATKAEIIWRPLGWKGPALNAAYERSIRGFLNTDIAYERWEFDLQQIVSLNRLRFLSFRAGCGFYTLIDGTNYFLDYTNFRDNNIPDGWYDEWNGEFSLLSSHWYNLSRYYVRSNVTYETPLLALSRLPWIGRFIEKERIYANTLLVKHLHPYIEIGYGFTTRWASLGLFMASRNGRYDSFGIKFGLELFRKW